MKLVIISDTHSLHNRVNVPDGDVLIHCGDFSNVGRFPELMDFNEWLGDQPHKHKLVIAGNHDITLDNEYREHAELLLYNATYLRDSRVEIEGIKFYGVPYTPNFHEDQWAFNLPRHSGKMKKVWDNVPEDTDVLITHGPPYGYLDVCPDLKDSTKFVHVGCRDQLDRIKQIKPKLVCFGHIHRDVYNDTLHLTDFGTVMVNASICDNSYKPINPPVVINI